MKDFITLKETTPGFPAHTYFVSKRKDRVLGYIKCDTNEQTMFSRPLRFDTKGRTFKEV